MIKDKIAILNKETLRINKLLLSVKYKSTTKEFKNHRRMSCPLLS